MLLSKNFSTALIEKISSKFVHTESSLPNTHGESWIFQSLTLALLKKKLLHRRWKWCKVMNFTWLFTMKSPYMKKWNHMNKASGLVFWRFECANKKAASFRLTYTPYLSEKSTFLNWTKCNDYICFVFFLFFKAS